MKKQRTFWLDDKDWKKLQQIIKEHGFDGKGRLERFMELLCNETFFFLKGTGKITITTE